MKKHILKVWMILAMSFLAMDVVIAQSYDVGYPTVNSVSSNSVNFQVKVIDGVTGLRVYYVVLEQGLPSPSLDGVLDGTEDYEDYYEIYGFYSVGTSSLVEDIVIEGLNSNTSYTVYIRTARGNGSYSIETTNPTSLNFSTDAEPFEITLKSPIDGAADVSLTQSLVATFNQNIQFATGAEVSVYTYVGDVLVETLTDGAGLSITGMELTINPMADFTEGTRYYVIIPPGAIETTTGTPFSGVILKDDWDFTTVYLPLDPPTLSPINGGTGVLRNSILDVTFDKDIEFGAGGTIEIYNGATQEKLFNKNSANVSIVTNNTLRIDLSGSPLNTYAALYDIRISSGFIKRAGINIDFAGFTAGEWFFTTEAEPFELITKSPVEGALDVPLAQSLVATFNQNIQLVAEASISVYAYDGDVLFETLTAGAGLSVSGMELTINPSADFAEGTRYYVIIPAVAIETTTGTPFSGVTLKDDWDFTTVTLPPSVIAYDPDGLTAVAVDKVLNLTFDRPIKFNESGIHTIRIGRNSDASTFYTYYINGLDTDELLSVSGNVLSIIPPVNFESSTQYYVEISDGAILSLADMSFPGISGTTTWTFTSVVAAAPPVVDTGGYSPVTGSIEISRNPVLELTFNENIVKGSFGYLRIFTSEDDEEIFLIPRSQAIVVDNKLSVPLTNITLQYGRQYYIGIDAGYVKSSTSGVYYGGISGSTEWYFTTETAPPAWVDGYPSISNQTVDDFQLDVWADVTGAFYGVLTQSSTQPTAEQIAQGQNSGGSAARIAFNQVVDSIETFSSIGVDFNDQTLLGQSYFLHLVYRSGGTYPKYGEIKTIEIDRIIPTVEKTYPANNSMVFPAPDAIEITFSELVVGTKGEALTESYFSLVQNSSPEAPIQFTVSVSAEGERTVATLRPTTVLMDNTAYTLTINPVYDLSGNSSAVSTIYFETDGIAQWTGTYDSNWNEPDNWGGTLPVDGKSVLIPGSLTNYPLITSETISVHNLTIAPGAVLSHSGGTLNVNGLFHLQSSSDVNASYINTGGVLNALADSIRVDQVISNPNVTYHISSPVLDATQLSIGSTQVVYFFNNSTGAWESNMNNPLTPGVGYITRSNNNLQFRGDLNFSSFSLPISRSTKGFGWNLIGNPYTAMLDFSKMINDNVEPTFWLWQNERGIYGTMNFESEVFINLNSNFIPSNHAFFVKVKTGVDSTNISFSPDYLSANTTTYLKSGQVSNVDQLKLAAVSGLVEDETAIAFISSASEGVDKYDSEKYLGGSANVLELFSLVGNTRLAINGMPLDETATIPLGYSTKTAGNYSIKLNTNTTESRLFLHDKVAEVTEELLAGSEYSFNVASPETNHSRFSLVVERVLTGESPKVKNVDGLRAMVKDRKLSVLVSSSMLGAEYYVVDMGGRLLIKGIFTEEGMVDLGQLPIGSYVIQSFNRAVNLQERQKIVVY